MHLDMEYIKVRISKACRFLIATSCPCVKNYPHIWCILLFQFVIYMFFPSIFISPIYSLPVIILLSLVFRFIVHGHQQNLNYAKGETNLQVSPEKRISFDDDFKVDERKNNSSQPQSVRRRNAKETDKRCDVQVEEDKDVIYSTIYDHPFVDKVALVEENPKEIREVEVDRVSGWTWGNSSLISRWPTSNCTDLAKERKFAFTDETGVMSASKALKDADDKEEEEARRDDKRRLMDLGISEMETNKRLESLIARRKARKLLSMQVRKTLLNMGRNDSNGQIASILVPRHSHFPNRGHGSPQVSPTPGSAPSILLPSKNPFDIPYDPHEEKPILTGGSFDQEFLEPPQKDIIFCRHESFRLGDLTPAVQEEQNISRRESLYLPNFPTRRASETHEYSRFRNIAGDEGSAKLISSETSEEDKLKYDKNSPCDHAIPIDESTEQVTDEVTNIHNEENTSEILAKMKGLDNTRVDDDNAHHEQGTCEILMQGSPTENAYYQEDSREIHTVTDPVNASDESSSSSSSEVNAPFTVANRDIILKSLSFSIRKNMDKEDMSTRNGLSYLETPLPCEKKIHEYSAFYPHKGFRHAHSFSIASDMQVEVSEESSPRSMVDESISVSDTQSHMVFGEDDENEFRSRSEQEISDNNVVEVPFSSSKLSRSEDNMSPVMLCKNVVQEDVDDSCVSSTETELHMDSQIQEQDYNHSSKGVE